MNLKIIKEKLKFYLGFQKKSMEIETLCGVQLNTVKGTLRKKVDQDDAWFFYLAKHNNIIFDIGSNVGYSALLAMIQHPDRNYLLVDPNPAALADANLNLVSNGLGKKACYYPAFVSNKQGAEVMFYTVGTGAAGSMYKSHAETASKLKSWFHVATVTLDYMLDFYEIVPDLIKIDVEGAEALVLKGAYKLAKEVKPIFMVEMHANQEITMEENAAQVLKWCEEVNYNAWYMKEGVLLENEAQITHRGKCHLLLREKTHDYPEYLKGISQSAPLPKTI